MWKHPDTCIWFEYQTSVALIVLYFHRNWPLCSASVFGWNSSNWASRYHGNGNLYFHHCWALAWTSDWPWVNAGLFWSVTSRKTQTFSFEYVFIRLNWYIMILTLVWFHRELLGKEEYWPILLSTTCIPAFLQLLILPWFPESPRYLFIDRGDDKGSKKGKRML